MICQRLPNTYWGYQGFNLCYIHTQYVIKVQRWYRDIRYLRGKLDFTEYKKYIRDEADYAREHDMGTDLWCKACNLGICEQH